MWEGRRLLCSGMALSQKSFSSFIYIHPGVCLFNVNLSDSLASSSSTISVTSPAASSSFWSAKLEKVVAATVQSGGPTDGEVDGDDAEADVGRGGEGRRDLDRDG